MTANTRKSQRATVRPRTGPRRAPTNPSYNPRERGWVYILTNPAMHGLVKVGYVQRSTGDPWRRALEIEGTGVPEPFHVAYAALVVDPLAVEQAVHVALLRHHHGKEFFRVAVEVAVTAIRASAPEIYAQTLVDSLLDKRATSQHPTNGEADAVDAAASEPDTIDFLGAMSMDGLWETAPPQSTARARGPGATQTRVHEAPPAAPSRPQQPARTIRFSAPYSGQCAHCGRGIKVTVTRHDRGTHCSHCHSYNDLAEFVRANFR